MTRLRVRARARKKPVDDDVIILANDIDVRDTSATYLRRLIQTFDRNKESVEAGKTPRIDGVVGRIDHDTTTYRTWPNFFAVTRFEQFLDAQNRRGYPGRTTAYASRRGGRWLCPCEGGDAERSTPLLKAVILPFAQAPIVRWAGRIPIPTWGPIPSSGGWSLLRDVA